MGLRTGQSMSDAIFILHQIIDKHLEFNKQITYHLHILLKCLIMLTEQNYRLYWKERI